MILPEPESFIVHRAPPITLGPDSPDEFMLVPFGDVHRNAPLCDVGHWKRFCEWGARQSNAYYIGMGDYDDMMSYRERLAFSKAELHESTETTIEQFIERMVDDMIEEMRFMAGRLLGLIEGNHYFLFSDGTTSTMRMCRALKCPYLGIIAIIRQPFVYRGGRSICVDICAHHGKGGNTKTPGGSLNVVYDMAQGVEADIYMMGHDHQMNGSVSSRLVPKDGHGSLLLSQRKQAFVRTGGFLKGYVPRRTSYIAKKMLRPTILGEPHIIMRPQFIAQSQTEGDFAGRGGREGRGRKYPLMVDLKLMLG